MQIVKKKHSFLIIIILLTILGFYFYKSETSSEILIKLKPREFVVEVVTTGVLEAKNSVKVLAPRELVQARIWQIKIDKIVEEGKWVKKGDFIASLDKSELMNQISLRQQEFEKAISDVNQAKIDTAIEMEHFRNELSSLSHEIKQKKLETKLAQYEPQAVKEQQRLSLEKTELILEQVKRTFDLQKKKALAKIKSFIEIQKGAKNSLTFLESLIDRLTIYSPQDGMIIYKRDELGNIVGQGSTINAWDPVVATLPDFSIMLSKTYVNEVDIHKIRSGQLTTVTLDAFPNNVFTGEVVDIASIGKKGLRSTESVFEVKIQILESDHRLRTSMTTNNAILVDRIDSVLAVPFEALHNYRDSINFVFIKRRKNIFKKEVNVGKTNDNHAVITEGLSKGDMILLSLPPDKENIDFIEEGI